MKKFEDLGPIYVEGRYLVGGQYRFRQANYMTDDTTSLELVLDDELHARIPVCVARITVCVVDSKLGPDEILCKTWSENEGIIESLIKTGVLLDTGRRIPAGHAEAWVCRLAPYE